MQGGVVEVGLVLRRRVDAGLAGGGQSFQENAHRREAVPAGMDVRIDDPAVAFAADDRPGPGRKKLLDHVDLADARARHGAAGRP